MCITNSRSRRMTTSATTGRDERQLTASTDRRTLQMNRTTCVSGLFRQMTIIVAGQYCLYSTARLCRIAYSTFPLGAYALHGCGTADNALDVAWPPTGQEDYYALCLFVVLERPTRSGSGQRRRSKRQVVPVFRLRLSIRPEGQFSAIGPLRLDHVVLRLDL